jgi:glucose 1-dehydrogenase
MPGRLHQKVAIITGAATGIGRATALAMAAEGAAVVVNYRGDPSHATEVVGAIEKQGGRVLAALADVRDAAQVQHMVEQCVQQFGRLDILVNNAGMEKKKPFLEVPLELWREVIDTDLTGPWICTQAAAKQMAAQNGGGRIINISSVHEDLPMPTNAPYCAAKGGLRMLMRTLAVELAPHRITVNNIAPGAIDTPMDANLKEQPVLMKALLDEIPLGRMGKPEEVAEMTVWLASDAADYVTGSTFVIDGGMLRHALSL